MSAQPIESHYRTYSHFLRELFGYPVFRISVNAGFTCPNRDGSIDNRGCIYCNNKSFSPLYSDNEYPIERQAGEELQKRRTGRGGKRFIIYFQPASNTYAPVEELETLYKRALAIEGCVGLAIGTRSDCIDDKKLALLESLASRSFITIEYGLQSPHDKSLDWMNRGHDYQSFLDAVRKTAGGNIYIGVHIILGLPGETRKMMIGTAREISKLPVDFLKIHQLQVVSDTPLEAVYAQKPFPLWSIEEYSDFICDFIEELRQDIIIQRLFSYSRPHLLLGPKWGISQTEINRIIHQKLSQRNVMQGRRCGIRLLMGEK